jgi:lysophospholipase L1-like esterase
LFLLIRKKLPVVPIAYISMKPSPSRKHLRNKMEQANSIIKQFLRTKKYTAFIDVYHKMLDVNGTPLKNIYIGDSLHMNANGYHIWQKLIRPYLLKSKSKR